MKQHFIIKNNQKHLLLFFAGWGMDETPFLTIHPTDKDWMICDGTLQGLNEQTLQKFQRRMCGSIADYKTFQTISPQRPMEELKEELAAIQQQYLSLPPSDFKWQKAIIGKGDRIFLPDNQYLAWENQVDSLEQVEAAHYQQELFNTILMQPEN